MIKLISSDMDGTLLDSYRQITPINIEAIKKAQENGINFIINTGREYPNARALVESAGLKCDLICSNGSCAFDKDGNLLFEHEIDKETIRKIFDAFNEYSMEPSLYTTEGRISLLPLEERKIYTRDVFIPAIQVNHPDMEYTLDDFRELVDNVIFVDGQEALLNSDHRILKISSNSTDHEALKKLRVELEKIPGLAVVSTVPTDIEITSIHAQKGSTLLDYAKRDGLTPDEIVAIGDSENDYSMLSIPGIHSVAMENACDMIRNICVYQTRANTRDGIAYIINCILADRENFTL
jgi:Cof subfamily protein (haloacid dehalogenase superfamily)